jgi:hypothetical protein
MNTEFWWSSLFESSSLGDEGGRIGVDWILKENVLRG